MLRSSIFRDDLFKDRVAIVTGGATGIGEAITRELALGGATVVIASRKMQRLVPTARGLSRDLNADVVPLACNIRDRAEVKALVEEVLKRYGKIDFLVNNGGGQFPSSAEKYNEKGWKAVIDTNLTGTWNMCQITALKHMLRHGGKIVNIVADMWRGFPGLMHTGAARAAVVNMTMSLAVEWARANILINCVAPGTILSTGMKNYPPGTVEAAWRQIPLKRLGTSEEIAWAVAYLLSPAGDFITGETIKVDGGGSLWGERWSIPDPRQAPHIEIPQWPEEKWPEFAITDGEEPGRPRDERSGVPVVRRRTDGGDTIPRGA
jgi:NAD(P)-dependent dehydrogenase (short-subunit alcohol dehydrogenase family)